MEACIATLFKWDDHIRRVQKEYDWSYGVCDDKGVCGRGGE